MSPFGRPQGEYRSAQHEGTPVTTTGRWALRMAAAAVLALVFAAYFSPHLVADLAGRLWACF